MHRLSATRSRLRVDSCAEQYLHLSRVCVSLSRREFGCRAGDRRTTELRKRDAGASLAANAAGIRLRRKPVVTGLPQSPGISGKNSHCSNDKNNHNVRNLVPGGGKVRQMTLILFRDPRSPFMNQRPFQRSGARTVTHEGGHNKSSLVID
jgi:hypothetical protein